MHCSSLHLPTHHSVTRLKGEKETKILKIIKLIAKALSGIKDKKRVTTLYIRMKQHKMTALYSCVNT
jgi:hypothetical protein